MTIFYGPEVGKMEVASCIETFYVLSKKTAWDGEETELTSESEPEIKVSS